MSAFGAVLDIPEDIEEEEALAESLNALTVTEGSMQEPPRGSESVLATPAPSPAQSQPRPSQPGPAYGAMPFDPAQLTGYIDACVAAQVAQVSSQLRASILGECEARFAAHRSALLEAFDTRMEGHRAAMQASIDSAHAAERRLADRLEAAEGAQQQHTRQLHYLAGPFQGAGEPLAIAGGDAASPARGGRGIVGDLYSAISSTEAAAARQVSALEAAFRGEAGESAAALERLQADVAALRGGDVVGRMGALEQQTLRLLDAVQALQLADEAQTDYQSKAGQEMQGSLSIMGDQLQELQDSFVALEKKVQEGRAAAADTAVALAERIGTMEAKGGAAGPFASQVRELAERLSSAEREARDGRDGASSLGSRVGAAERGAGESRQDVELLKSAIAGLAKKVEAQADAAGAHAAALSSLEEGAAAAGGLGERARHTHERLEVTEEALAEVADTVAHIKASLERLVAGIVGAEGRISLLEDMSAAGGGGGAGREGAGGEAVWRALEEAEHSAGHSYGLLRQAIDEVAGRVDHLEGALRDDQEASLRALEALMGGEAQQPPPQAPHWGM